MAKRGIINTVKSFFLGEVQEEEMLMPLNPSMYRAGYWSFGEKYSQSYGLRELIIYGYNENSIGRGIINGIASASKNLVYEPYWNGKPWKSKKFDFDMNEALMQLLLTGTVVLWKKGSILNPEYQILNTLDISEYRVRGKYTYRYIVDGYYIEIPESELVFIKEKNYSSTYSTQMGISRLFACKDAIDSYKKTYLYNLSYLDNHGANVLISNNSQFPIVSDAVYTGEMKDETTSDIFDRLVNNKIGTSKRAGKVSTTSANITVHKLGDAPKDVLIFDGLKFYAKELSSAYGYPSILANDPDSKTYANYEQAEIALYTGCVIPFVSFITKELEKVFGYEIYINTSNVEALQESQEKRNQKAQIIQQAVIELNQKVKEGVLNRNIAAKILSTEWGYEVNEAMDMIQEFNAPILSDQAGGIDSESVNLGS